MGNRAIRILFVEDHHDTAVTLARLLERRGYAVRVAGSVAAALEAAASEPFDLLICDIGLPDGSGCDVMRRLHGNGGANTIRGIALTAHGMAEDVRQSYEAGFLMHLTKPLSMNALDDAIHSVTSPATCACAAPPDASSRDTTSTLQ